MAIRCLSRFISLTDISSRLINRDEYLRLDRGSFSPSQEFLRNHMVVGRNSRESGLHSVLRQRMKAKAFPLSNKRFNHQSQLLCLSQDPCRVGCF
jgi:hypothetical protein